MVARGKWPGMAEVDGSGGGFADLVGGYVRGKFNGFEAGGSYVEDAEVGDDAVDYCGAGERKGAGWEELGAALRGVLHDDDDAADS